MRDDPSQDETPQSTGEQDVDAPGAMTAGELAEARRYGRQSLACSLIDRALDLAYLAVMAMLLARPIDAWLTEFPALAAYRSLRLTVLFAVVFALHAVVSFPLSCYAGHVLEHRFGLSRQSLAAWLWRYGKTLVLGGLFGMLMLLGLFRLIWTTGPWWWLVAAGAFYLVGVVLGRLVPVLILPLFYKIERLDAPELVERLAGVAAGTGLTVEGVYRIALSDETVKANAMLAGLGRTRRVLLGDTLLDRFTPDEIEVIFAHEIGHHVCGHLGKVLLAGIVSSAAGFWVCDRLLAWWTGGPSGLDYAALPVATLPLVMLLLTAFVTLIEPVQNAISRRHEKQADRYALSRTGARAAYASAFRKLARLNKADPDPPWLEVVLFHGHPPIAQRVALAEEQ